MGGKQHENKNRAGRKAHKKGGVLAEVRDKKRKAAQFKAKGVRKAGFKNKKP
jgi:hypothetical protein